MMIPQENPGLRGGQVLLSALVLLALLLPAAALPTDERVARILARYAEPSSSNFRPRAGSVYATRFPNVSWDNANWRITTTNLDQGHYQSRMSVANGYLGINVAAVGPFFELDSPVNGDVINGWPLFSRRQTFATIGGFFDSQPTTSGTNFPWLNQYGGESVISGVPHWSGLIVDLGDGKYLDANVNPTTISGFSSTLDAKAGVTSWKYTWTPKQAVSFNVAFTMFAHKLNPTQAVVQLQITPSTDVRATIVNILDGYAAVRTDFVESGTDGNSIFSAVRPRGINNVTAYIYATMQATAEVDTTKLSIVKNQPYLNTNASTIAQGAIAKLVAGRTTTVMKFVGGASSDGFPQPKAVAKAGSLNGLNAGFQASLASHGQEWAHIFGADTVDNYADPQTGALPNDANIVEAQITAVTNPYYLLQNTVGANALKAANNAAINANSISVGGLGSDSYAGLVFWDAEIWMQPGLVAAFPDAAQQIGNYRTARYGQAKANAQTAYQSSKKAIQFSKDAAVYSWTSGRFGNCTGTGPCFDYEYHINGDIGLEISNYLTVTGDSAFFKNNLFPVYDSIATFYSEILTKNGSKWSLTNMTDPDEFANMVDNGGYTMALISEHLQRANAFRSQFGVQPNPTWTQQAQNVLISRNEAADITLEYTGMPGSIAVKQADVVLNTYPLDYTQNYTLRDSLSDLNYYAGKQSPNGPGMTYAIFSIVANEVSPSGCSSYTYQQYSEQPYARAPWFQFSEQLLDDYTANGGTHPAYPFLTGHGGANQVVLFGYLGLRLLPDFSLHVDPSLPPQIPNLKYRTFYWQGYPISATSTQTHTTLTRLSGHLANANPNFASQAIPVLVGNSTTPLSLAPGGTITLTNRPIGSIKTVPGNIAQCQPVSSTQSFLPGQFPISAVDGASSTKWQPPQANAPASITVSLPGPPFVPVSGLSFDWGQYVPLDFSVVFYNTTPSAGVTVASGTKIAVSNPYNPQQANQILPPSSNTTNVTLSPPMFSGKFAVLTVSGNQGLANPLSGPGATVAEFAIIAQGNSTLKARGAVAEAAPRQLRDTRLARLMAGTY